MESGGIRGTEGRLGTSDEDASLIGHDRAPIRHGRVDRRDEQVEEGNPFLADPPQSKLWVNWLKPPSAGSEWPALRQRRRMLCAHESGMGRAERMPKGQDEPLRVRRGLQAPPPPASQPHDPENGGGWPAKTTARIGRPTRRGPRCPAGTARGVLRASLQLAQSCRASARKKWTSSQRRGRRATERLTRRPA